MLPLAMGGCASLLPESSPPPALYSLDGAPRPVAAAHKTSVGAGGPTLVVSLPRPAAGLDGRRMLYVREPQRLEHFARNQWIDTPARMLAPMIVAALQESGAFGTVLQAPTSASGDYRLDTTLVRLQQEFDSRPSRTRVTIRAYLLDAASGRVVASKEVDTVAPAPSDNPQGGAAAGSRAVRAALQEIAAFSAQAVGRQPVREVKAQSSSQ